MRCKRVILLKPGGSLKSVTGVSLQHKSCALKAFRREAA
jgi:hypothetical protein